MNSTSVKFNSLEHDTWALLRLCLINYPAGLHAQPDEEFGLHLFSGNLSLHFMFGRTKNSFPPKVIISFRFGNPFQPYSFVPVLPASVGMNTLVTHSVLRSDPGHPKYHLEPSDRAFDQQYFQSNIYANFPKCGIIKGNYSAVSKGFKYLESRTASIPPLASYLEMNLVVLCLPGTLAGRPGVASHQKAVVLNIIIIYF